MVCCKCCAEIPDQSNFCMVCGAKQNQEAEVKSIRKDQSKAREKASKLKNPTPVELPSGKWRCQLMVNGERISVVDEDPTVAHAKVLAIKAGVLKEAEQTEFKKITLTKAIDKYIEDRGNLLSPSTIRGYRVIQRNRFPGLMKMKVIAITKADVQRAVNAQSNLTNKTLKNTVGLIHAVIAEYQDLNLHGLKYPQKVTKEHAYLDADQIVELINACQGNIAEIPILLAVWLGLRRSEIIGLHWDTVDFEQKQIRIERSVVPNEKGKYVEKSEMKNETSRRVLPCPDYILAKLEAYQPDPEKRSGRIFQMDPHTIYRNLRQICDENGIPFVGVHGLRHTNASVMLSLGVVDKVAMQRGGWATNKTMKNIYQHVFKGDRETADDTINSYFQTILNQS